MHLIQCLAFSNKINNVKDKFDNVLSKKKIKMITYQTLLVFYIYNDHIDNMKS
jgi:hypothetical protein